MKILIRNTGCDDETLGLAYFKNSQEFNHFIEIIRTLNQNSDYPCMPTIRLYSFFEDEIVEVETLSKEDKENLCARDIIRWNNMEYTFANPELYFSIITNPERDILYKKEINK